MARAKNTTVVVAETDPVKPSSKPVEPEVTVIKTAVCLSSSGRSELSYLLGQDRDLGLHIKIAANTGNGHFNDEWLSIDEIHRRLMSHNTPLSAQLISNVLEGKSVNTLHFVFAALLSEGFLIKDDQNSRRYRLGDVAGFMARTRGKSSKAQSAGVIAKVEPDDDALLDVLLQSA